MDWSQCHKWSQPTYIPWDSKWDQQRPLTCPNASANASRDILQKPPPFVLRSNSHSGPRHPDGPKRSMYATWFAILYIGVVSRGKVYVPVPWNVLGGDSENSPSRAFDGKSVRSWKWPFRTSSVLLWILHYKTKLRTFNKILILDFQGWNSVTKPNGAKRTAGRKRHAAL